VETAQPAVDRSESDWALTRSVHARLSAADVEFRELVRREPVGTVEDEGEGAHGARAMMAFTPQPWPLFLSRRCVGELAAASVAVSVLLRSLPERLFGNDPDRLAVCFGVEATSLRLGLRPPNGIAEALTRGDFLFGPDGFRCVELNIASNLGGWENRLLAEVALATPRIRDFVRRLGRAVTFRDPFRQLILHIVHGVRTAGLAADGEVNLALTIRDPMTHRVERLAAHLKAEYAAALATLSPAASGQLWLCHPDALAMRHGALYHGGTRVHAVVDHQFDRVEPVLFRCFKAGTLRLYNAPILMLLSDKRTLALLSEHAESDAFTAEERRTIERHVPWTRRLLPGPVTWEGEREELGRLVLARREEMVLKLGRSMGGRHVLLGRETAAAEWESAIRQALAAGDWIVQRVVPSFPLLCHGGQSGAGAHDAVWGPFVFGSHYAGMNLRVQPQGRSGVVNVATRDATLAAIFEVDDRPPA